MRACPFGARRTGAIGACAARYLRTARLLAEIGDDRTRFADASGLKAYAGSAPITRASGTKSYRDHTRVGPMRA